MAFWRKNFILFLSFVAVVIAMLGITVYTISQPDEADNPEEEVEDSLNDFLSGYERIEPQNDITSTQLILQSEYDNVYRNGDVLLAVRYIEEGIQVVENEPTVTGGIVAEDDLSESSEEPPSIFDLDATIKHWEARVIAQLPDPCLIGAVTEGDVNDGGEKVIRFLISEDETSECENEGTLFDGTIVVDGPNDMKFRIETE
jgi:hypothetical protein